MTTEAGCAWENPVKTLLRDGKPAIGITITAASVEVAAQAANMGFDFLWIEMEHSPITLETARAMILSTRGLKAVPFTRVPVNELWTAKRVLDIGSLGVIFPFTSTAELARQAVAACRYPPDGLRGAGPGLATFRWPAPEGYFAFANRNVMVIAIIENAPGVDNVEEIAATPGIDALFVGTQDLSFSLGVGGQRDHPTVREALRRVVAAARSNGLPVGQPAPSPELIPRFLDEGFLLFQAPAEMAILAAGARLFLDPLGKTGFDPKSVPLY